MEWHNQVSVKAASDRLDKAREAFLAVPERLKAAGITPEDELMTGAFLEVIQAAMEYQTASFDLSLSILCQRLRDR